MPRRCLFTSCLLAILFSAIGGAQDKNPEPPTRLPKDRLAAAAPMSFSDLDGRLVRPVQMGRAKAVVIIFSTNDCPVANAYSPALAKLYEKYRDRGVRFYLVHVDPATTTSEARIHASDYRIPFPVLRDTRHRLVQLFDARKTPEVVLLSQGEVAYQGRIDDRYVALGRKRPQARRHDLRESLEEVLAGKRVRVPRTSVIGCYIPKLD